MGGHVGVPWLTEMISLCTKYPNVFVDHPHSEDDLRYIRRRYFTIEAGREAARAIANATFAARHTWLWGQGTTAVASDSTHFSAFDQNIFTEWHSRYRRAKRGVLIYWTVDTAGAMAIHSQLLQCSASEVHAMVESAMRHGTNMTPYGEVQLRMDRRLDLTAAPQASAAGKDGQASESLA